jgi:hypothetical protein
MARGFQGDTLSTVLMIGAGVLVWQKMSKTVDKVGERLGVGVNSAGVFQSETTDEINAYQKEVDAWSCNWAALGPNGKSKAKTLANKIFVALRDGFGALENVDEDKLFALLRPLSANELRAVAISFGVPDKNNLLGLTLFTGHIFRWFEEVLHDNYLQGHDLTEMRKIWAKTGLWV